MSQRERKVNKLLTKIVKKHLLIETLEVRRSDRLDFHEIFVGSLRDALLAAYKSGVKDGIKEYDEALEALTPRKKK